MDLEKIIREKQGTIVDVRTPGEFAIGNIPGSVNIPLKEISQKVEEIKKLKTPVLLCCESGARSDRAYQFLSHQGINCFNGGSWKSLQNKIR